MIGKISGRLDYRAADHVLIDVRGVGYIIYLSDRTMAMLPAVGQAVALYTDLLVREDNLQLFGFTSLQEKEWHRLLMSVQGIGAKASMAILGALGAEGIGRAIALGDMNAVKVAKGVGPKTAQRVVLELKDKAPAVMALGGMGGGTIAQTPGQATPDELTEVIEAPVVEQGTPTTIMAQTEALSALAKLGYGPADAAGAVAHAAGDSPDADTAGLIRAALKLLAPKG